MEYSGRFFLFWLWLVMLCSSSLISADQSRGVSTAKANNALFEFYRAIKEHRCQDALGLRPGYSEERCQQITDIVAIKTQPVSIQSISADAELIAMELDVQMIKNGMLDHWIGFAAIFKQTGGGIVLDDSFSSHFQAGDVDGYLSSAVYQSIFRRLASQVSAAKNLSVTSDILLAPPVLEESPALQPAIPSSIDRTWTVSESDPMLSVSPKANSLLQACWTPQELRAYPGERKVKTRLPVDGTQPERRFLGVVIQNLAPDFACSIRSVKPRNGEKLLALTFDLCEKSNEVTGYDGELVDILRAEKVHATFYAGGKWMRSHPERTMQLMADPLFELGNHAWTHGNFRVLRGQDIEDQIQWTQAQYEILRVELLDRSCATSVSPNHLRAIPSSLATFRFPYGTCDAESLTRIARAGLYPIQWDVVTGDPAKGQTADHIVKEVLTHVRPGSIVIAHANGRGWHTAEAFKTLIPALRVQGYRFVTVSDLLHSGELVTAETCYEQRPGDNQHYDRLFGRGTE